MRGQRPTRPTPALGRGASLLALADGAMAQNGSQTTREGFVLDLPGGIYSGPCREGGGLEPVPVYELGVIGPAADQDVDGPVAEEVRSVQLSPPNLESEASIDAFLDDLLAGPPALAVRQGTAGDEAVGCGGIDSVVHDDELAIGPRPLPPARWYGAAVLEEEGGVPVVGDDRFEVSLYLFQEQGQTRPLGAAATPEPTVTPNP